MRLQLATFAAAFSAVVAVYTDEAYSVDAQLSLLGLPQSENTFFAQPHVGSKATLIYTLSDKCVLGAVNPKDGSLVWRQVLRPHGQCTSSGILAVGERGGTLLEALDGALHAWSAADGRLSWEKSFAPEETIYDVQIPESAVDSKEQDVYVVLGGKTRGVRKLDGKSGVTKWSYLDTEDEPYMVSPSGDAIYYISLHSNGARGTTFRVTSLDSATGTSMNQVPVDSDNEHHSDKDVILLGANSAAPMIAWTDISNPTTLKVNILGQKSTTSFDIDQNNGAIEAINIIAPQKSSAATDFLVHFQTSESHWAEVYHTDVTTSQISKQYSLPVAAGQGAFSISTVGSTVYFTRFTEGEVTLFSSGSAEALQRWPLGVSNLAVHGDLYPIHASTEVAIKSGSTYAIRSAVLFSSGDWVMIRNGDFMWSRPESLAGMVSAQWATTRVQDSLVEELKVEGRSNIISAYIHRLKRHVSDLAQLPLLIQKSLSKLSSIVGKTELSETFGFNKLIIATTDNGRIIALEAGNNLQVAWNLEATGKSSSESSSASVIDDLPEEIRSNFNLVDSADNDVGMTYELKDGSLLGIKGAALIWQFSPRPGQQFIEVTSSHANEPIASIGKALGNRKVLYKYLNPNAIIVTAIDDHHTATIYLIDASSGKLLNVAEHRSVDTSRPIPVVVSENWFAYSMSTFASDASTSTGHILVMNELYESSLANDRGPLASTTNYSSLADYSAPHVISATYHVPSEISLLAVTQTAQGITSRQLLAYLAGSGSIVAIPPQALDPRRTVGADPTAIQIQEEGLSRYAAFLDFDPKWYLTHKRDVLGVRHVSATPAALESTSLVVAWGLDVFTTRVAPSFAFDVLGSEFNKVTMSATVVVLAAAAFAVAPLIERKMTDALWQSI